VLTGKKMKREEHHFQDKVGGIFTFYFLFFRLLLVSFQPNIMDLWSGLGTKDLISDRI
jgi:hypothetical protein